MWCVSRAIVSHWVDPLSTHPGHGEATSDLTGMAHAVSIGISTVSARAGKSRGRGEFQALKGKIEEAMGLSFISFSVLTAELENSVKAPRVRWQEGSCKQSSREF